MPLEDVPTATEIGPRLADALGLASSGKKGSALEEVRRHLAARQMLIALDNFEHLANEAGWLDELARACPRIKLIVTSRTRPMSRKVWTMPVEGLPCPEAEDEDRLEAFDAARLFVRTAQRVEPGLLPAAAATAIVDICRQVEGLPLALELAASFTRVLSCEAIAAELRESTELLRTADPARPARQASMEVVFEQSWRHLAPAERQALARLAIFRGGFTPAAARSVARASLPVLAALADKSLLRKAAPEGRGTDGASAARCHLHPLVQQFALHKLEQEDGTGVAHAAIAAAHSRHFLRGLAAASEPLGLAQRQAMRDTDTEFANLRAAWQWAAGAAPEGSDDLAHAALALMSYCDHRGRSEEGLQMLREGLPGASGAAGEATTRKGGTDGRGDAQPARIAALLGAAAAHLEYRLDRYAEAEALARRSLTHAQRCGDGAAELQCTKVLAATCLRLARLTEAQHWYEHTLALAQDLGDARNVAGTLDNLSLLERNLGHLDAALDLSRRALLQHRSLADAAGVALCLNNQSVLQTALGDLDAALETLLAARQLCERHGLPATRGLVEANLADLADKQGDPVAMERHARAALEISESCGQRATVVVARQLLMVAAVHQGDLPRARRELAGATEVALAVGRPALKVNGTYLLAILLAAQGDRDCAARVMEFALTHPSIVGHDREVAEAYLRDWGGRSDRPWPGPELDALLLRIVLEADLAYAPLLAELRASGA